MIQLKRKTEQGGNGQGSIEEPAGDKRRSASSGNGKSAGTLDIIELLPVPVVFFDRDFNIKFANEAGASILGCTRQSCIGKKCYDLFKFPLCNSPKCQARRAFEDGKTYSGDVEVKAPGGNVFFRCYTVPIKDKHGKIIGALEYFIDATRELVFALEMGRVYGEIAMGRPEARTDYSQMDGLLRRHAKGTNVLLDSLLGLIMGQDGYFKKFAKGEKLERWQNQKEAEHGCWKDMFDTFNEFIDSINNFMDEMDRLTKSSVEGKLDVRGDAAKFKGCWAQMVTGLNSILDSIIEPLDEAFSVLKLESQNDLTTRVCGEYKGDLNKLKEAVNESLENRIQIMKTLKKVSSDLAAASESLQQTAEQSGDATQQIATSSQQVAKGASDQAVGLQDTLSAIEKLVAAIDQIAKGAKEQTSIIERNVQTVNQVSTAIAEVTANADHSNLSARDTSDAAQKGAEMVQSTIKGMENIKNTMDSVADKVSHLGERSREIGKIIATINDIADQTNLLALNAAIEAARAGEQGRGFAVVADEVRKLAERASTSTKEIEELINNIQNGVQDMVKAMTKGTEEVANGYELATRAGQSLDEILTKSREMGNGVDQISKATQQLKTMSTEMVKLSDNISAIVEENTAATEEMSATAKTVSKSVEEVAGVAEENSAATEEVSAAAGQISAQMQQVVTSGGRLSKVADEFKDIVAKYKMNGK